MSKRGGIVLVLAISIVLVGSLAAGYAVSVSDTDSQTIDEHEPQPGALTREDLERLNAEDLAKPRFSGNLLGFYIATKEEVVPSQYVSDCDNRTELPDDQAGEFGMDVLLPPPYVLDTASIETGVVACEGQVRTAGWKYTYPQQYPGELSVTRSRTSYIKADVPAERVSTEMIGGREAIVLAPLRPEGMNPVSYDIWGSEAAVIFVEPFGSTTIVSIGVPFEQVLEAAELVAAATR